MSGLWGAGGDIPGDGGLVFVSYSREDADWQRKFVKMLEPSVRRRGFSVWSDERILAGEQWSAAVEDAIAHTRAALLLVSPDFLGSAFIMDRELPALSERGVALVPVLVRPCLWEEEPVLAGVQWGHDPKRDGPLSQASAPEGQIVRVSKRLLERLPERANVISAVAEQRTRTLSAGVVRTEPIVGGMSLGELSEVPEAPPGYVERKELASLRAAVLGSGEGAVGVTGQALGFQGQGGVGKTVLAAALARDETVRRHFPDGIFWVTAGARADLVAGQIDLLTRLGADKSVVRSTSDGIRLLRAALAESSLSGGGR